MELENLCLPYLFCKKKKYLEFLERVVPLVSTMSNILEVTL
jgi:hypothetical protein